MTTTDTNVQNPTASSPQVTAVGTPVTDEFDLGITQEDSPVSASAILPLDQEKGEKEVKSE